MTEIGVADTGIGVAVTAHIRNVTQEFEFPILARMWLREFGILTSKRSLTLLMHHNTHHSNQLTTDSASHEHSYCIGTSDLAATPTLDQKGQVTEVTRSQHTCELARRLLFLSTSTGN